MDRFSLKKLFGVNTQFARLILLALLPAERAAFVGLTAVKAIGVLLDLGGIALVGLWVSKLSGARAIGVIDSALKSLSPEFLSVLDNAYVIGAVTLSVFTAKGALSIFLDASVANLVSKIEHRKSKEYLELLSSLGLSGMERFQKARLFHALIEAPEAAFGQGLIAYSIVFSEIFLLASISIALMLVSPGMFLAILFIFVLIGILSSRYIGSGVSDKAKRAETSREASTNTLYDIQHNFRQIIALGKIRYFVESFSSSRWLMASNRSKVLASLALPRYFIEFGLVIGVGLLVILSTTSPGAMPPTIVIGVFIAGLFRMVAAILPLQNQLNLLRNLSQIAGEVQDLESLIGRQEVINKLAFDVECDRPVIWAKDVSFSYANDKFPIISNLSFEIPFGAMVSLEGRSGKGKSTLADLLLRLRTPTTGEIGCRSRDGAPSSTHATHQHFAYVPQRIELISGSLFENLTLEPGKLFDVSEALTEVIEIAGLTEMISGLPEGLETRIDRNSAFSGGQIQRIGFARALLSDANVLLLDEVTTGLDRETERLIVLGLEAIRGQKTIIYISHNPERMPNPDIRIRL